ncbi:MAG TPA: NAD(P)H-hydrate epimerase, partial [Gammaproteobacteria bacterium]|nr:NAD(P)H-hydrate epimerase [Gammaproteobacteria bacterium]
MASDLPLFLYTAKKIKALDRKVIEKYRILGLTLMERAGEFAFQCLMKEWPMAREITIICGPGNNGGDGYVLARLAKENGCNVKVYEVGARGDRVRTKDAYVARQALLATGIQPMPFVVNQALTGDVIVDALLGTGARAPLKPEWQEAICAMNQAKAPKFAIDLPSGLSADLGSALGEAVQCQRTATFIGLKLGLFTGAGVALSGKVSFSDLQVPSEIYNAIQPDAIRMDYFSLAHTLPHRLKDAHKGDFGHVFVIGAGETH